MAVKDNLHSKGGGKTSFTMNCSNSNSASVNLEVKSDILTLEGAGIGANGNMTMAINVYGCSDDNKTPYYSGFDGKVLLASYKMNGNSPKVGVNVSGYKRVYIYAVYGSGSHGNFYIQVEN